MEQPKETIIQKAYDLLKFGIVLVGQFPQKHKFTLGDRMQGHLSDVLEIFLPLLASSPTTATSVARLLSRRDKRRLRR